MVIATDFGRSTEYRAPWQEHFAKVQTDKLLKKFVLKDQSNTLDSVTFEKFKDNVKRLEGFQIHLDPSIPNRKSSSRDLILHRARHICHYVLTPFVEDELFEDCRHSGGSTVGVPFSDTSIEAKWTYPVTVTSACLSLLVRYLGWNQQLHFAIKDFNGKDKAWYRIVDGSVAATVPKDREINRFIAKEPTGNMFLQQGAMSLMYKRLALIGLDLSTLPDLHRHLAWLGSLTGNLGTIDWSQASDCVLTELVEFLFPAQWSRLLLTLRSPVTFIQKVEHRLPMISSMGNATTFPVETLIFWSLAVASLFTKENPRSNSLIPDSDYFKRVTVFGDDCILPTEVCDDFIDVTCSLGFVVNRQKTFTTDRGFRESCGGDYLHGVDVRPFYLKGPAGTKPSQMEAWLYIIGNSVLKKYMSYFGQLTYMYDKAFFAWYFGLFESHHVKIKVVPEFFPDDAGLKIFPDLLRFLEHYEFAVMPIRVNQHGTVRFSYLRNSYPERLEVDDHIRYAQRLLAMTKQIVSLPCDRLDFNVRPVRQIRNDSAYVVASAITCNLTF